MRKRSKIATLSDQQLLAKEHQLTGNSEMWFGVGAILAYLLLACVGVNAVFYLALQLFPWSGVLVPFIIGILLYGSLFAGVWITLQRHAMLKKRVCEEVARRHLTETNTPQSIKKQKETVLMHQDHVVVYPVIISYQPDGTDYPYLVTIPALDGQTEGKNFADALEMARDYIGTYSVEKPLPPSVTDLPKSSNPEDVVTLVDVDVDRYKRQNDTRTIRKTVTLPSYLNEEGMRAGVNFSEVLRKGLESLLGNK